MSGRAIYRADDGTETDITNAVQILWDGVIGSLDWGSGFWAAEDAGAVAWIGQLFGFKVPREPGVGVYGSTWTPATFAEAIATYEKHRAEIDVSLPDLP
jgi:hypothetical protein